MTPGLGRIVRHLLSSPDPVRRAFPPAVLSAIERAIRESEATHLGEIRFAVEGALSGAPLFQAQTSRERAIDVFAQLRMWDTERRNAVLIYLLLADHCVEIVADRGISGRVAPVAWDGICRAMEAAFRQGRHEAGVIDGVRAISTLMQQHFPADATARNELPDKVVLL